MSDAKWVAEGVALPGKSKSGLAKRLGRSPQVVTEIVKGNRLLKSHEIKLIEDYTGLAYPGHVAEPARAREPELQLMPILGVVEAGAWREVVDNAHRKPKMAAVARDPRFPDAPQFLLRVQGDSMNAADPPMPEGVYLRCAAWAETGLALRTGQIVIARRCSAAELCETTVKRVHVFPDRTELRPESTNPVHKPLIIDEKNHTDITLVAIVTGVHWDVEI